MTQHTLFVCSLCQFSAAEATGDGRSGGQYLIDQITPQLTACELGPDLVMQPVRCMAACDRACNVALAAPGKLTFILQGLSPLTAASEVVNFCQQYIDYADGKVPYRSRADAIKQATAYVLPSVTAQPVLVNQ